MTYIESTSFKHCGLDVKVERLMPPCKKRGHARLSLICVQKQVRAIDVTIFYVTHDVLNIQAWQP